jgi:glycosyltransferase involved in cell wall biosynthesis
VAPKIIVSGLLRDGLGLGEATRGYAKAFAAAGCEVYQHLVRLPGRPFPNGDPGPDGILPFPEADSDAEADFVLVCLCPPELETLRQTGSLLPAGKANAGLWIWDVDPLPASWADCGHRFDEIWSPTSYVTGLLVPAVDIPIHTAPPSMRLPCANGASDLLEPGVPTVVTLADAASSLNRKNPAGAIEAFVRAFAPYEGPRLVVKIWNGDDDPAGRAGLEALTRGRGDIVLVDRWLARPELVSLLAGAACFLSLHRAEGFGLPIFEALALGTPVVATGSSGPMDFLDDAVAHIVPATRAPVPEGDLAYPANSFWAEPDIDRAAEALRSVWEDPIGAQRRAERGRQRVNERLTPEAVGPLLRAHVEELLGKIPARSPRAPLRPRVSVVTPVSAPTFARPSATHLQDLAKKVRTMSGEVLAAVAEAGTIPEATRPAGVRVIVAGGSAEAALRAAALAQADGDLIAFIAYGSVPEEGWWDAYEEAFSRTGAPLLFGPPGEAQASPDNCVLSRDFLRLQGVQPPGWLEGDLLPRLSLEGLCAFVPGAQMASSKKRGSIREYGPVRLKVGLVGCGRWGRRLILRAAIARLRNWRA